MLRPTIKGVFVKSHINALKSVKGEQAHLELEKRYGKPLNFKNSDDVPVVEEEAIILHSLDILNNDSVAESDRNFRAGRLHFVNFTQTPLARILFPIFKSQFKLMMMNSNSIAGHIFQGIVFKSTDLGEKKVKVKMENSEYHPDHFRGLFYEWLTYAGLTGEVMVEELGPNIHEYTISWQ